MSNPNKVRLLREGRAFEDKVRYQETKYYKYQNNNPNIGAVKIHVNEISGLTKIIAKRTDPRLAEGAEIKMSIVEPNVILVSDELNKPIYLQITGVVNSIYTVSVSTIHAEHPTANSLVMAEDVEYSLKLLPYSHATVEIHPIESQVVFEFDVEGGSILVCEVDNQDQCKGDSMFMGNKGGLNINAENAREVRLRLANYVNNTLLPSTKQNGSESKLPAP